jgi:hypothetical protein
MLYEFMKEPPFRRLVKPLIRRLPLSVSVKALWDAAERPQYLHGVLHAAAQAKHEGRGLRHRVRRGGRLWVAGPAEARGDG